MKRIFLIITAFAIVGTLSLTLLQFTSQASATVTPKAAPFPAGQWTFESTTDSTGIFFSTNGACIQLGGTWYATTSGKGSGYWYLKGTSMHLHGNYAAGGGLNDSFELTVNNPKLMTGYLQEWNDSGTHNRYFISKWKFVSDVCAPASK